MFRRPLEAAAGYVPTRVRRRWIVLAVLLLLTVMCWSRRPDVDAAPSVATFNIRRFPENDAQIDGAFAAIEALGVPIVGVQEIRVPAIFAAAAREHLPWDARFVTDTSDTELHLGVLFDGDRFALDRATTHPETAFARGLRPTLQVDLVRHADDRSVQVFVVHLKARSECADTRARQLQALADVVRRHGRADADVYILGDFNSVAPADAIAMRGLAVATATTWTTAELPCTAYHEPDADSTRCIGGALDHVFARTRTPTPTDGTALARGPCEALDCADLQRCPIFHREVSDHCPVVFSPR